MPAELPHHRSQAPAGARRPATLRDLDEVEQSLRGDAFDTVVANFAAGALQPELPSILRRLHLLFCLL
jgi:hypothetical protein